MMRLFAVTLAAVWLGAGPETTLPHPPAFIQDRPRLQRFLAEKVVSTLARSPELARFAAARQTGPASLELRLKEDALLPALFRHLSIRKLLVEAGRLHVVYAVKP